MKTGEDKLIQRIAKAAAFKSGRRLALGIGDDAALFIPRAGFQTILTCDWFLEGSHFLRDKHPPESIGWKCLARAVSDIAAMGGAPTYFLLSVAIPDTHTGPWLHRFLTGLGRAARRLHCRLAGGDTTRSDKILMNVTAVGEIRDDRAVPRSGAKPGDLIYVTGRLGEAEFGLRSLLQSRTAGSLDRICVKKHLYPEPRLAVGQWLAEKRLATSMMDLSDGLSTDLPRLCVASGVGADVENEKLPVVQHPSAGRGPGVDPLQLALHARAAYELLCP